MIESANCTLFHELLGHTGIQSQPFPFYVGFMKNTWTVILRNLLVSIQGQNVSLAEDDCDGNQEDQVNKVLHPRFITLPVKTD